MELPQCCELLGLRLTVQWRGRSGRSIPVRAIGQTEPHGKEVPAGAAGPPTRQGLKFGDRQRRPPVRTTLTAPQLGHSRLNARDAGEDIRARWGGRFHKHGKTCCGPAGS